MFAAIANDIPYVRLIAEYWIERARWEEALGDYKEVVRLYEEAAEQPAQPVENVATGLRAFLLRMKRNFDLKKVLASESSQPSEERQEPTVTVAPNTQEVLYKISSNFCRFAQLFACRWLLWPKWLPTSQTYKYQRQRPCHLLLQRQATCPQHLSSMKMQLYSLLSLSLLNPLLLLFLLSLLLPRHLKLRIPPLPSKLAAPQREWSSLLVALPSAFSFLPRLSLPLVSC